MNLDSLSDEYLQQLASDGDRGAEEILSERYIPVIKKISRTYFILGGDIEDIIQEGTFGLISAIRQYSSDISSSFRSFAVVCIKNRIISAIKSAASNKHNPLNDGIPLEEIESDSFSEYFRRSVEDIVIAKENRHLFIDTVSDTLTIYEKRVLTYYLDGLSYSEISAKLNKDVKSIDNAVQRIRRKLREKYSGVIS
ncbi:MAG: sigma-70 family RNA polymerase sigma factor [Oscillospiraceae bacterium]|nr:sigma-70 family RNA polymerase sigma factor [Oscillospiraceae bacterium]